MNQGFSKIDGIRRVSFQKVWGVWGVWEVWGDADTIENL